MDTSEYTKANIKAAYAVEIRKLDKNSIAGFINDLLDMYFQGRVVCLNAENQAELENITAKTGKSRDYIVNFVLSDVEIVLPEEKPKLKIMLDEKPKVKKKKITVKNSFMTD